MTKIGLKLGGTRREERRGEEEEEEKRKEEDSSQDQAKKVWNFGFLYGNYLEYGFCMDHMNFKALYG